MKKIVAILIYIVFMIMLIDVFNTWDQTPPPQVAVCIEDAEGICVE